MPRSGFVPFGAEQPWPEIRPADDCNPTYQRRTPGASRGYRLSRFPEFPPVGSVNDAVHAAIARFGWLLVFSPCWVLSSLLGPRAPFPLTFPSPPKLCPHCCELFSNDQDHRTALERDFRRHERPETSSFAERSFSNLLQLPFPFWGIWGFPCWSFPSRVLLSVNPFAPREY